jgi:hypothetical protein
MPIVWGSDETDSVESECICEDKRIECDGCGHRFLHKDMSLDCMLLALCKLCNGHDQYLMDNMAVARFKVRSSRPYTMLCVELIGDRLQLTIRANHLGISIVFPGMTKKELVFRWLLISAGEQLDPEIDCMFDTAFLRLDDKYLTKSEVHSLHLKVIEEAASSLPQGGISVRC